KRGITSLPCIGDGRQSGTSASPSIINASPEAAVGGGLALLKTGDRVRIDLNKGSANMLVPDAELAQRRTALEKQDGYKYPPNQPPRAGVPARQSGPARPRHGSQPRREISSHRAKERAAG